MGRRRVQPFEIPELEVLDTLTDGRAMGRHENRVIFMKGAIPGDVVRARVFKKEKKNLVAEVLEVIKPAGSRIVPKCTHFGDCGGCKWQHMSYEAQLHYKEKYVRDAFERIGGIEVEDFRPILGAPEQFFYRNKLEFSFANKRWLTKAETKKEEELDNMVGALGFHVPIFFDKIVQIDECFLQTPLINEIRNAIHQFATESGIPYYDHRAHEGFLRNLMFRTSRHTGEIMVVLIVAKDDESQVATIFEHLAEQFPGVQHWCWIHNDKKNSSYSELSVSVWKGEDFIVERLDSFDYRIRATSFFQTNPEQAENLYNVVREFAGPVKYNTLYDLYCGSGSIGIYLSGLAEKIVGVEYVESSIKDAWDNVALNNLDGFSFHAGDMKKLLTTELVDKEGKPDLIVTDPPRAGMDKEVVARLLEIKSPRIIYVSCNPSTQARDLDLLSELYRVKSVQPVDMFPQTAHVENVALLELR